MSAAFPLIGKSRGALMALFSLDRYPSYYGYAQQLITLLAPLVDVFVLSHDSTLTNELPGVSDYVSIPGKPESWRYFNVGVQRLAERGAGTFFYSSADDLFPTEDVERLFHLCESECDVAFCDYKIISDRNEPRPWIPSVNTSFADRQSPPFKELGIPECSVYRTSLFVEFPCLPTMKFICSSMRSAAKNGRMPRASKSHDSVFGYFQYGQDKSVDRSFMMAEGGY